jgi:putative lipoic acid-binding regulatory protein
LNHDGNQQEDARTRAIALLEATHKFPVEYDISIIAHGELVLADLRAAVEAHLTEPLPADAYQSVPSRGGKYASHRFRVPCEDAETVLALYERVRLVKGVITVM